MCFRTGTRDRPRLGTSTIGIIAVRNRIGISANFRIVISISARGNAGASASNS